MSMIPTNELAGLLLANSVAKVGLMLGIYTRDPEVYTKPLINTEPNFVGNLFYAKPRTSIEHMQPVPPKFQRPAFSRFQPELFADQGLYIIERLRITIVPDGEGALATTTKGFSVYGDTYLQAGLRAVVSFYFGDTVDDEALL